MKHIHIELPADREHQGRLSLMDARGMMEFGPVPARGKADNFRAIKADNRDRDPTLPYGDTPSGEYAPARVVMFAQAHERLGKGWIPMEPKSGQALAAKDNGRSGLGIHAGRGDGPRLIPTYGCVRLRDSDFAELARHIGDEEVSITVEDI